MRELISKALDGLDKSGRFDANKLANVNVKKTTLHVDFDQINSTINW